MDVGVAEAHRVIAAAHPDAECLVYRERRLTWAEFTRRSTALARYLAGTGLGCRVERDGLAATESGQDHLGIYLLNGNEYLESMAAAFQARLAPFNVNYRYVAGELAALFADADVAALVIHSAFTPALAAIRDRLPSLRVVLQVADESCRPLAPGAVWYEDALALGGPAALPVPSPDDLYLLYTGGTTGVPRAVMWRNADARVACFGGPEAEAPGDLLAAATERPRVLVVPPLMHGSGHWMAWRTWWLGGTVFLPWDNDRFDPAATCRLIAQEHIGWLMIVGDAFARPLVDYLQSPEAADDAPDLSSLTVVLSGGAPLSGVLRDALHRLLPTALVVDGLGASETGGHTVDVSGGAGSRPGRYPLAAGNVVLTDDRSGVLAPGTPGLGWLTRVGRQALGYLGDPVRTAETYPTVGGVRYGVPGDRVRWVDAETFELLGRDATTINTGGEKVFAEEVEAALKTHPAVYDCVVTSRPSDRWGHEVVAVVACRAGSVVSHDELCAAAAATLARYKLPKATVFVDTVARSAVGKADYAWASAAVNG